jgi:hypothetical protein
MRQRDQLVSALSLVSLCLATNVFCKPFILIFLRILAKDCSITAVFSLASTLFSKMRGTRNLRVQLFQRKPQFQGGPKEEVS